MNFFKRIAEVQNEMKVPKDLYNSFGKYKYRNAETILNTAKPICLAHDLLLTVSDEIVEIGGRIYVKATARLDSTIEDGQYFEVSGYAREAETKKGMDDSQVTGATSSYARKYALNGLFCLDDTKDADTDEYHNQTNRKSKGAFQSNKSNSIQALDTSIQALDTVMNLRDKMRELDIDYQNEKIESWILKNAKINTQFTNDLSDDEMSRMIECYKVLIAKKGA